LKVNDIVFGDKMNLSELEETIRLTFIEVYERDGTKKYQNNLENNPVLLETGMDSLGFAILVTQLEDRLDFDPFSDAENAYYPTHYNDFVKFYFDNQPA
jgi:acyl carrier protein